MAARAICHDVPENRKIATLTALWFKTAFRRSKPANKCQIACYRCCNSQTPVAIFSQPTSSTLTSRALGNKYLLHATSLSPSSLLHGQVQIWLTSELPPAGWSPTWTSYLTISSTRPLEAPWVTLGVMDDACSDRGYPTIDSTPKPHIPLSSDFALLYPF